MDKLAKQLKDDAALIDAEVSDELDRRIAASLRGVTPERPARPVATQASTFWWASSLTGLAAALAVIAIINSYSRVEESVQTVAEMAPETSPVPLATTPRIVWKTESAMLTRPLQQELEDLQADLKKAEEKVKKEIGL